MGNRSFSNFLAHVWPTGTQCNVGSAPSYNFFFQNEKVDNGTPPPNLENDQVKLAPGVLFDKPPRGYNFGDCLLQPPSISHKGDVVTVR